MDIRDIIKMAREITDRPGVVVPRASFAADHKGRLDQEGEKMLDQFNGKIGDGFSLVAVLPQLHKVVGEKSGKQIVVREAPELPEDVNMYGSVEDYGDRALISIRPGMNPCWKRFTVTKELMHIYSGTCPNSPTESADLLIKAAQDSRYVIPKDNSVLDEETSAFYLALEVMIPWCLREQFNMMRELGATHYQIAKAFMIPERMVEHFVGMESETYAALSRRLNRNI